MSIATRAFSVDAHRASASNAWIISGSEVLHGIGRRGGRAASISARTRRKLFRAVLFLMSGLLALAALGLSARAAGGHVLVIPADDGYGLSDCLAEGSACGPIVANAWCKAHGHGSSGTLGPIDTKASSLHDTRPARLQPHGFAVTCGE